MTIDSLNHFVRSATGRLWLTYLSIIMLMSLGFSIVFYHTSTSQLERQLPPDAFFEGQISGGSLDIMPISKRAQIENFLQQRIDEGRSALRLRLTMLNLFALIAGSGVSYALAKRTLKPIEESMEAQAQFISDASHELRTPLTAIKASNEVALRNKKLNLREAKEVIHKNTEDITKLQELTDSLLSLIASHDTHLELTPVSLQEATTEALNHIIPLAQAKHITVSDQVPDLKVLARKQNLVQVIAIILDNAIKYSPGGTTISLSGAREAKSGSLHISDQGIGIDAAELPSIFRRFYRVERSRGKHVQSGYGLGLSIAATLMERQNGEISVESTPGKGSTFSLKLPLV